MKKKIKRCLSTIMAAVMIATVGLSTACSTEVKKGDFTDEAPDAATDGRAKSALSSLLSEGYVADTVHANIDGWLLEALDKNPGIIDKIRDHSTGQVYRLKGLINDGWNMLGSGIVDLAIKENASAFGSAIEWKHKTAGMVFDLDFAFARQSGTTTDWKSANDLWVYADVSQYGKDGAPLGVAFEESDPNQIGGISADRESWGLKNGASVMLYPDGAAAQSVTIAAGGAITSNNGRVHLPAGFRGWIRLPLNNDTFFAYWNSGQGNGMLDLADVHQFQLNVEGTASSVGNSALIGPFLLSGEMDVAPASGNTGDGFTQVWDLSYVQNGEYDFFWDEAVYAFYGEFPGKLMTGIAYSYRLAPSAELKEAGDRLAAELAGVQSDRGYLGIFDGDQRFGGGGMNWDVWCHYHDIYGLYQWYLATGSQSALQTAIRAADCVMEYFKLHNQSYSDAGTPMCNLAISHAFALLYRETKDQKYLDEAKAIIENCWSSCGDWLKNSQAGKEFYQMDNNYGNRWEVLHSIMTLGVMGEITGEKQYSDALEQIWYSIIKTERHNTGSFSVGEGACGDPFKLGGIETCCSIAWMALTTEYLQTSRNSLAADELELSFYNTMLGSLMDGDRNVTYDTPMNGTLIPSQQQLAFQTRPGSPDMSCCQSNSSRGLAELSQWAVLTDQTGLYLNYYGDAGAVTKTPSGQEIVLTQQGGYPLNGNVKIAVSGLSNAEKFTVWFRVPSWAHSYSVTVNGQRFTADKTGVYFPITGTWNNGDEITVEIGMTFHFWKGAGECQNMTSFYYGPVLFAADSNYTSPATVSFDLADIKEAKITAGDGVLLTAEVKTTQGETAKLISFADVGSNSSSYRSWLRISGDIEQLAFEKGGTPVWCSGMIAAEDVAPSEK